MKIYLWVVTLTTVLFTYFHCPVVALTTFVDSVGGVRTVVFSTYPDCVTTTRRYYYLPIPGAAFTPHYERQTQTCNTNHSFFGWRKS